MKAISIIIIQLIWISAVFPQDFWMKTYDFNNNEDGPLCVVQDQSNNYYLVGYSKSDADNEDGLIVKTNQNGDTLWSKIFGSNGNDRVYSVCQTFDNQFVAVGRTGSEVKNTSDFWAVKFTNSGEIIWNKHYGGPYIEWALSVVNLSDTGFVLAGFEQFNTTDALLIKINQNGDSLWSKSYGGSENDWIGNVITTFDNNLFLTGFTCSFNETHSEDVWLLKTNLNGDTIWTKTYGGNQNDWGRAAVQCADSGFCIAANTETFGNGGTDAWLIRTDENGDSIWTKTFGGAEDDWLYAAIDETNSKKIVAGGGTHSFGNGDADGWLIETSASGDSLFMRTYGGESFDLINNIKADTDNSFILAGHSSSYNPVTTDAWLLKTDSLGCIEGMNIQNTEKNSNSERVISVSPNPFHDKANIHVRIEQSGDYSLKLFDLKGNFIYSFFSGFIEHGVHAFQLDNKQSCQAGFYVLQLIQKNKSVASMSVLIL